MNDAMIPCSESDTYRNLINTRYTGDTSSGSACKFVATNAFPLEELSDCLVIGQDVWFRVDHGVALSSRLSSLTTFNSHQSAATDLASRGANFLATTPRRIHTPLHQPLKEHKPESQLRAMVLPVAPYSTYQFPSVENRYHALPRLASSVHVLTCPPTLNTISRELLSHHPVRFSKTLP